MTGIIIGVLIFACIACVVTFIVDLDFYDFNLTRLIVSILFIVISIAIIAKAISLESKDNYSKYPLKLESEIIVRESHMIDRTKVDFNKPVVIKTYYRDTPWYLILGGPNDISKVVVEDYKGN